MVSPTLPHQMDRHLKWNISHSVCTVINGVIYTTILINSNLHNSILVIKCAAASKCETKQCKYMLKLIQSHICNITIKQHNNANIFECKFNGRLNLPVPRNVCQKHTENLSHSSIVLPRITCHSKIPNCRQTIIWQSAANYIQSKWLKNHFRKILNINTTGLCIAAK